MSDPTKDEAAPPPPKGGLSTKVVVLLLAVNVTIGAGSVAAQFLRPSKAEPPAETKPVDNKAAPLKDKNGIEIPRPSIKLDTLTVRLRNPEVDRYARATFVVELASPADNNPFKLVQPQMQDAILTLLSDRDSTDLAGAVALQKLKSDIFDRAELIFGKDRIHAVYISEFIIQ